MKYCGSTAEVLRCENIGNIYTRLKNLHIQKTKRAVARQCDNSLVLAVSEQQRVLCGQRLHARKCLQQ